MTPAAPHVPHPALRIATAILFVGMLVSVRTLDAYELRPKSDEIPDLGFQLHESAKERGIDFRHHAPALDHVLEPVMPHVAALGAAVSVCDYNGDGWPDLYATNSDFLHPNALYENVGGQGKFEDVAAQANLAELNRPGEGASMGSVWADYDNDGHQDVFVVKWGYQQLFHNKGDGTFEDVSEQAGVRRWMNSNAAVWLDYDRDGRLDLYVTGYFSEQHDLWHLKTTRIMQSSFEFADNGGHNVLFHNEGDGRFLDVTAAMAADTTRWTMAVASADMNADGWPDLYLANDYGPEELFVNLGGKKFERAQGVGLDESSKSGMSVALGDFENDGRFGVYVTNISKSNFLFQGNNLRMNRLADSRTFYNLSDASRSVSRAEVNCGWAWGAQFGDLNNDGNLDLFVVNGMISASREDDYWYDMSKIAGGAGSVFEDALNWPAIGDKSLSGYELSRCLLSTGKGPFVDVAKQVGASDEDDGRAVAFADLYGRGALDVIIANQKGPLLVYENQNSKEIPNASELTPEALRALRLPPANPWVQFRLHGTKSNRDAIGAEVTLYFGGKHQSQTVQAGSGFSSQNDLKLHFGLGRGAAIEKAVVRWPSGLVQTIPHPSANTVNVIEEPSGGD